MELRPLQVFRGLGLETRLYIVIFVATVFSGSKFGFVAPYLIVAEIVLLSWMSVGMSEKRKEAFVNSSHFIQLGIMLFFSCFLLWQVSTAYAPSITAIYLRRFLVFSTLLLVVPKPEVAFCAIKAAKYYSLLVAISIVATTLTTGEKTGGLVGNHHYAGMMMSIACLLFLIDYFQDEGRLIDALGFALAMAGLFISGKRMFTVLVVLGFVLVYILSKRRAGSKKELRLVLVVAAAAIPLYLFVEPVRELVLRMQLLSLDAYTATSGRNILWEVAMDIFASHSLSGIGFGNFAVYMTAHYDILGVGEFLTHNIYYGLLAETGIVGFISIVLLFAVSLVQSGVLLVRARDPQNRMLYYVMTYSIALQVWFVVYGFTGNGIYDWHEFFFYISALAMMLSVRKCLDGSESCAIVETRSVGGLR